MKRHAWLMACAAAAVLSFAANNAKHADAGNDERGKSKPVKEFLVGKWAINFVLNEKGADKESLKRAKQQLARMKMFFEFKADGTTSKTVKFDNFTTPPSVGKWMISDDSGKTIKMKLSATNVATGKERSRTVELVIDSDDKFRIVKDARFASKQGPALIELIFTRMK